MRSKIKLVCRPGAVRGIKLCGWTCPRESNVTAQFRSRSNPNHYAILHPSTKRKGQFQLSTFDAQGPIGDRIAPTCNEVLRSLGRGWKLEQVG